MRFEAFGGGITGFAIAPQKNVFGRYDLDATPTYLQRFFGADETFSWTTRYLYAIPLYVFYADNVKQDELESVQGDDVKGRKDLIKGDVLIFGRRDDVIRSLTPFEISMLSQNMTMEKKDNRVYAKLNNVSLKTKPMELQLECWDD